MLKACKGENYNAELDFVCEFCKNDLSKTHLQVQLPRLQRLCKTEGSNVIITIYDVVYILGGLSPAACVASSFVWNIMKLIMRMPATNASSKRTFSARRRIKTYLHTMMSQEQLNNLLLLHVNKVKTVTYDLLKIGRKFVAGKESRLQIFGDLS